MEDEGMPTRCAECGAMLPKGETCQSLFESFMALEFSDPAYGAVHYITVTCFMVQHGRYSDEALRNVHAGLRAYLNEGVSADELRLRAGVTMDQRRRTWRVRRQPAELPLPPIAWDITIADVRTSAHDAALYRDHVTRWARRTLEQMFGAQ